jgi:hypothetical protein
MTTPYSGNNWIDQLPPEARQAVLEQLQRGNWLTRLFWRQSPALLNPTKISVRHDARPALDLISFQTKQVEYTSYAVVYQIIQCFGFVVKSWHGWRNDGA